MENNTFPQQPSFIGTGDVSSVRTFMANVFSYMTMALVISGVMAWWFASTPVLLEYLYNVDAAGYITGQNLRVDGGISRSV